ncbi:type II secretion system F family protein [Arenibaculum sp.]|jgi:tight adherence protein B|uniref:type II secretion system F family protein n=1 Tax=Arenibaculum sp. TaxID=2865862 RepID=UPI002E1687E8|nr:type II secretion system F family protein [Arenibaculum sp.]
MNGDLLLPVLLVFLATLAATASLLVVLAGGARRRLHRRIGRASGQVVRAPAGQGPSIRIEERKGLWLVLERTAGRLVPRTSRLRERLARTGRGLSVGGYCAACLATGLLGAGVCGALGAGPVPSAAAAALAGLGVPHLIVVMLIRRRTKRFLALFPDAIDLIVRGLRSGLPVTEQMAAVGTEIAAPVGTEFVQVANAIRFGRTIEEALWDASRRLDIADFKFFVVSIAVQRETGGNLSETLSNLSDILRRRRQMRLKIKAMASEASASAMILGALPAFMLAILLVLSPDYVTLLFVDPLGRLMGAGALALQALGVFVMARMVRFEI